MQHTWGIKYHCVKNVVFFKIPQFNTFIHNVRSDDATEIYKNKIKNFSNRPIFVVPLLTWLFVYWLQEIRIVHGKGINQFCKIDLRICNTLICIGGFWFRKEFDDGQHRDDEQESKANEGCDEGSSAAVAIAAKFVAYFVPPRVRIAVRP